MVNLRNILWDGVVCSFEYIVENETDYPGKIVLNASTGEVKKAEYSKEDPFHTYAGHAIRRACEMFSEKDFRKEACACWY
ncbi:MAG: hypothetical protein IJW83_03970 [Clostridia bacterium]|nr:hypothetical protein [Clostridia bacterium]